MTQVDFRIYVLANIDICLLNKYITSKYLLLVPSNLEARVNCMRAHSYKHEDKYHMANYSEADKSKQHYCSVKQRTFHSICSNRMIFLGIDLWLRSIVQRYFHCAISAKHFC